MAKAIDVLVWCVAIIFISLFIGAMVVIFPPMGAFGVVGLLGALLLWATPELRHVPDKSLRTVFFVLVFTQLCVPGYYTIQISGLPWISLRRVVSFIVIVLFSVAVAGSKSTRARMVATLANNHLLAFCAFGFLGMLFLSICTSENPSQSISYFSDTLLNWYVPFLACIIIIRSEADIGLMAKSISLSGIFVVLIGLIEFTIQRRFLFDVFPKRLLALMSADNPAIAVMLNTSPFRNGLYRASSIFFGSLSFGEFCAMIGPLGAYFIIHAANQRERILGVATTTASIIGIVTSGARGGYVSFLIAMPLLMFISTLRYSRIKPYSLAGAISFVMISIATTATFALTMFWPRLRNFVLGGGETATSTEARFLQWEMAKPHILSNPITGHGAGMSADVIGFYGGTLPTVDSYILTLLVETGVPGFLFFFGMIASGICICLHIYLTDSDQKAALCGPLACSLVAFGVYRIALSQRENQTLFFMFIGLVFALGRFAYDRRVTGSYRSLWGNRSASWCGSPEQAHGVLVSR